MQSTPKQDWTVRIAATALLTAALGLPTAAPARAQGLSACPNPEVAVVNAVLTDDGDDDGFADTWETVEMQLTVRNIGETNLTGVTASITSDSPRVCITQPSIDIGDLAMGQNTLTDGAFTFHVTGIERADAFEELSADFDITITSDAGALCVWGPLTLDLDLDAADPGAGPTTWVEGFESGTMGSFEPLNLDAGIPGNNDTEGLINGDGYRCQHDDPDWQNAGSYGSHTAADCYPGNTLAQADATFWQVDGSSVVESPDGGRAFSGTHSLYYGVFLDQNLGFTTPMAVVEAAGTTDPVYLGLDQPSLTIWHQASLMDDRSLGGTPPLRSADRGVVALQVADESNDAVAYWVKLLPYRNVFDAQVIDNYFNCHFDPIDDGNTEDDFFDPTDPERRLGPSSTCYPEFSYAYMGDTGEFDPAAIGNGSEGPGVQGSLGEGTWVRSDFDLSRWRGRRVRLRFQTASIKADFDTWEGQFMHNPNPGDDGWWIDDVTVAGALATPATLAPDVKDNTSLPGPPGEDGDGDGFYDVCDNCAGLADPSQDDSDLDGLGDPCDPCFLDPDNSGADPDQDGFCAGDNCPEDPNPSQADDDADGLGNECDPCLLDPDNSEEDLDGDYFCANDNCPEDYNLNQADSDLDGWGNVCDCAPDDETVHPGAVETNDGLDDNCNDIIDEMPATLGFHNPDDADELSWEAQPGALRYQVARDQVAGFDGVCTTFTPTTDTFVIDENDPGPGEVYFYLVRSFVPNLGSWGLDSNEEERHFLCGP